MNLVAQVLVVNEVNHQSVTFHVILAGALGLEFAIEPRRLKSKIPTLSGPAPLSFISSTSYTSSTS
jgi:hypothetical protein